MTTVVCTFRYVFKNCNLQRTEKLPIFKGILRLFAYFKNLNYTFLNYLQIYSTLFHIPRLKYIGLIFVIIFTRDIDVDSQSVLRIKYMYTYQDIMGLKTTKRSEFQGVFL